MGSGSEWLSAKIQERIDAIERTDGVDECFFVFSWRRRQLRRESEDTLRGILTQAEEQGYEIRGGTNIAEARLVFIEPLVQYQGITTE